MLITLIGKECKMWLKSMVFYAFLIILFLFYVTQMGSEDALEKPMPNQEDYGSAVATDEEMTPEIERSMMENTFWNLYMEYLDNSYAVYPFGFYKEIIPSEADNIKIEEYIRELSGLEKDEWNENTTVSKTMTVDRFYEIMKEIDEILGGGSSYSQKNVRTNATYALTYEQAIADYNRILDEDHVTGAYARLFSDYIGILLGILPAFFAVARVLKEKRSDSSQVVYSKKAGSLAIVLSRYIGMTAMMFLSVFGVSCISLIKSVFIAKKLGAAPDYLAYLKYCVGWLLPTILVVTAIAYLCAELSGSILSIIVSLGIAMLSIIKGAVDCMSSANGLIIAGKNIVPRFNYIGKCGIFRGMLPELIINRISYTGIAVVLVFLIVIVYDMKRKGVYKAHGKVRENRNSKCEA